MDMKLGLICLLMLLQGCVEAIEKTLKDSVLEVHNAVRKNAGLGELTWDNELEKTMTDLLNELQGMDNCPFKHSDEIGKREKYRPNWEGENLFAITSSSTDTDQCLGMSASLSWYNEIQDYKYPGETSAYAEGNEFMKVGHFTSMMWRTVDRIGCATVSCPNRIVNGKSKPRTIVGCHTSPSSNVDGQPSFTQANWDKLIALPTQSFCCQTKDGEKCVDTKLASSATKSSIAVPVIKPDGPLLVALLIAIKMANQMGY